MEDFITYFLIGFLFSTLITLLYLHTEITFNLVKVSVWETLSLFFIVFVLWPVALIWMVLYLLQSIYSHMTGKF